MIRTLCVLVLLCAAARTAAADDAIAFGKGGLMLGAKTIYKPPVQAAAFDPAMEIVWFESKGKLQAIDLRDPKYKPVVVLKKFPVVGSFDIYGASHANYFNGDPSITVSLYVGAKAELHTQVPGYGYDPDGAEKLRKKVLKAKITGKKWMAGLEKRTKRDIPEPTEGEKVMPPGGCNFDSDEPSQGPCTTPTAFGTTKFQLAEIAETCGDMCHDECMLYDPATKKWLAPAAVKADWSKDNKDTGPCGPFWNDSDGKTYYYGDLRCTLDTGQTCEEDKAWQFVGIEPAAS